MFCVLFYGFSANCWEQGSRFELILCWPMLLDNLFSTLALNWDWIFWQGTWELESTIINTVAVLSTHFATGIGPCKRILREGKKLILECKELGILLIRDLKLPLFQEWWRGKVIRSSDSQRSAFKIDEANLWHLKCAKVSSRLKGAHVHMCSFVHRKLAFFVQPCK